MQNPKIFIIVTAILCHSLTSVLSQDYQGFNLVSYFCSPEEKEIIDLTSSEPYIPVCAVYSPATELVQKKQTVRNRISACTNDWVEFVAYGSCELYGLFSSICPPPDAPCQIQRQTVCAYKYFQPFCHRYPCRQEFGSPCSACLKKFLFYTIGPCQ